MSSSAVQVDERTRLLPRRDSDSDERDTPTNNVADEGGDASPRKKANTPLPWPSILALCFCRLTEPIAMTVIFPFVNQAIADYTGVPASAVGYKAGVIESLFTFVQFCTILQWGRLSDRIGRKPVILMGLTGCSASVFAFGLSRSFPAMVLARMIAGLTNGNVGVVKSSLAELTDATNEASAFALFSTTWSLGSSLGPILGGYLSNPTEKYPSVFGNSKLLKNYKYLLPCFVAGLFPLSGALIGSFVLQESLAHKRPLFRWRTPAETDEGSPLAMAKPSIPSLKEVLTPRVRRALLNYAFMAFIAIAIGGVLPLFMYTPIHLGGLGFSEVQIGKALSGYAVAVTALQLLCFPPLQTRFGTLPLFRFGAIFYPLTCAMFPLTAYVAYKEQAATTPANAPIGLDRTWTWIALSCQLFVLCIANLVYSCNILIIQAAAPSRHALGTLNGIAQMMASFVRSTALASTPALFALSISRNLLGGHAVWLFMTSVGMGLVCTSWTIKDAKASWRDDPKPPEASNE